MPATTWSRRGTSKGEGVVRAGVTVAVIGALVLLLAAAPGYRWEWNRLWGFRGLLLSGLLTTAWIAAAGLVLGLVFGFLGGLARLSRNTVVNQLGAIYVEVFRGTPFLVQILIAFFCVSFALATALESIGAPAGLVGLAQDRVLVGVLALGVFAGAYVTEIFRAAVQSIDRGQTEAALSQGMTRFQVLRLVLVPQALRRMVPPLAGELVGLVKDSSLLYVIGVTELTKAAYDVYSTTRKTYEPFLALALLYLLITFPLSRLARWRCARLDWEPGPNLRRRYPRSQVLRHDEYWSWPRTRRPSGRKGAARGPHDRDDEAGSRARRAAAGIGVAAFAAAGRRAVAAPTRRPRRRPPSR